MIGAACEAVLRFLERAVLYAALAAFAVYQLVRALVAGKSGSEDEGDDEEPPPGPSPEYLAAKAAFGEERSRRLAAASRLDRTAAIWQAVDALPGQAAHLIVPLLRDADHRVQIAAARALGALRDASAIPALTRSLRGRNYEKITSKDGSPGLFFDVCAGAAIALAKIGTPEAARPLLELAREDPERNREGVAAAAAGLRHLRIPEARQLRAAMSRHEDEFIRRCARGENSFRQGRKVCRRCGEPCAERTQRCFTCGLESPVMPRRP